MIVAAFLPCLFLGDSTGVGAGVAYNATAAQPCPVIAREGASPQAIARSAIPAGPIGTAVIGSGSNDPASPSLASILAATRARVSAQCVVWLLPYDRRAAYQVRRVAASFGDMVLDLAQLPTRDQLHPTTYAGIAIALHRLPRPGA